MSDDQDAKITAAIAKLSPEDQKLAQKQRFCPVLKTNLLGSMGKPVKIVLDGQPVFLCCKGCEQKARDHSAETLKTIQSLTSGAQSPKLSPPLDSEEAEIESALSKLSPADRAIATAQRFCAVRPKSRLGSMDVPIKILIEGKAVFLCCEGCETAARRSPAATLATVERLKSANQKK